MASAFGLQIHPAVKASAAMSARIDFDPYAVETVAPIMAAWFPFVFAMNGVNRAMGNRDLYPFVLAPPVIAKLSFIHDIVQGRV
jgi:hypothetical protein